MFTCAGGHSGPPLRRGFVSLGGKSNIDRRRLPTPGGIGTHGIHPPRERPSINVKAHTANQNRYTREGTAALPYAEDLFQ